MSKKIYESKVAEDAAKRFRMLCEYTFNITEDDGEDIMDTPEDNGEDIMDTPEDDGVPQEQNTPQQDEGNGDNENGATGFNPNNENGEDMMVDNQSNVEPMQPEDEVIDIDELTQSQEETEEKVENVKVSMEKGFEKLLDVVKKLDKMIDNSTNNMLQIKQEIEKRNPTPLEKLNMRTANDSYPFNISPNEYWKEKEKNSNYRIGGENEPDGEQYTITQGDLDKITDFQRISKELNTSEYNQNLMNIFGLR